MGIEEFKRYCDTESVLSREINDRNIKSVYHFTSIENAISILNRGIHCKTLLEKNKNIYLKNDELRLDGLPQYISLSISYPNYKMLYKYNSKPDVRMFIIELSPSILFRPENRFYETNAANGVFKDNYRSNSIEDFQRMFTYNRNNDIASQYTADSQAEIMVPLKIPSQYFTNFHFKCQDDYELFCYLLKDNSVSVLPNCFINNDLFNFSYGNNIWR